MLRARRRSDVFLENNRPNAGNQTTSLARRPYSSYKRLKTKTHGRTYDVLTKLRNAGYRLSESRSELFKTETEWIGQK